MSSHTQTTVSSATLSLGTGHIGTDFDGIQQLWKFYNKAKKYRDCDVLIKLDDLTGIDGNLCALIGVIVCSLFQENNLTFSISVKQVREKCEVLFANQFIDLVPENGVKDKWQSVKYRGFELDQKDDFINYLADELLSHEGMQDINELGKEKIIDDMTELYGNIHKHADTKLPFFVCGQYFPKEGVLKFTIADIGQGFFPKINQVQPNDIRSDIDAIDWAMNGNSTKTDAPGGKGLKNIRQYLTLNHGYIQVVSGTGAWQSTGDCAPETFILPESTKGATINLIFSKNNLISDDSLKYG